MRIALIAHDAKKADMIDLARHYRALLGGVHLVATGTTGRLLGGLGLDVQRVSSGPYGGDLQIGAAVAAGDISTVIFLRDPLSAHPHEPDISALMKVCDTHDIPLATNVSSARMVLETLSRASHPQMIPAPRNHV